MSSQPIQNMCKFLRSEDTGGFMRSPALHCACYHVQFLCLLPVAVLRKWPFDCWERLPSHKPCPPRICGSQLESFLVPGAPTRASAEGSAFANLVHEAFQELGRFNLPFPDLLMGRWATFGGVSWWPQKSHFSNVSLCLLLKLLFRPPGATPRFLVHSTQGCFLLFQT